MKQSKPSRKLIRIQQIGIQFLVSVAAAQFCILLSLLYTQAKSTNFQQLFEQRINLSFLTFLSILASVALLITILFILLEQTRRLKSQLSDTRVACEIYSIANDIQQAENDYSKTNKVEQQATRNGYRRP